MYLTEISPERIVAAVVFVGQWLGENDVGSEPERILLEQDWRDRIPGLRGQMHRRLELLIERQMGVPASSRGSRRICVADGWDCTERSGWGPADMPLPGPVGRAEL